MKELLLVGLMVHVFGGCPILADDDTTNPSDACASICNDYTDMCMPKSLDPQNSFQPHCEGNNDVRRPPARCLACIKQNGLPKQTHSTTVKDQTSKTTTDHPTKCEGPCGCDCDLKAMCMPAKLDPEGSFPTHCTGEDDARYPSQGCVNCLIKQGQLGKVTGKTTKRAPNPPVQTGTKVATPVTDPATTKPNCRRPPAAKTPDPCLAFCENFVQVCMPPDIDPCFDYYPHCDYNLEGYRPASAKCLQCINVHGLRPNSQAALRTSVPPTASPVTSTSLPVPLPWECFCSRLQTMVIESPTTKCPRKGKDCVFLKSKGETSEEYSCSCGPRNLGKKIKKHFFGGDDGTCENCPLGMSGKCTCKRTVKKTRSVKIETCTGFSKDHGRCNLKDPSAVEETTVANDCSCTDCSWWNGWW